MSEDVNAGKVLTSSALWLISTVWADTCRQPLTEALQWVARYKMDCNYHSNSSSWPKRKFQIFTVTFFFGQMSLWDQQNCQNECRHMAPCTLHIQCPPRSTDENVCPYAGCNSFKKPHWSDSINRHCNSWRLFLQMGNLTIFFLKCHRSIFCYFP